MAACGRTRTVTTFDCGSTQRAAAVRASNRSFENIERTLKKALPAPFCCTPLLAMWVGSKIIFFIVLIKSIHLVRQNFALAPPLLKKLDSPGPTHAEPRRAGVADPTSHAGAGAGPAAAADAPWLAVFPATPRGKAKLGLSFYKELVPPTISLITPGTQAAGQRPQLKVGLVLRSINGESVAGLPFQAVVFRIKNATRPMVLSFEAPPARGAGGWLDTAPLELAGSPEAVFAALRRLSEDDSTDALRYIVPRRPAVAQHLYKLVRDGRARLDARLHRETGLAMQLAGDFRSAQLLLERALALVLVGAVDEWRAHALLGELNCAGMREHRQPKDCVNPLMLAVQLADAHESKPGAAPAYAALAQALGVRARLGFRAVAAREQVVS